MMRLPRNQPFWTSVILHLVVLTGLFLGTIMEALKPKEEAHVFEMVSPPAAEQAVEEASVAEPEMQVPELPPVPNLVAPEPEPRPQQQPPEPEPQRPKLITREEFLKQYGEPKPRQPARQSRPRPSVTVPQIDVPRLVVPSNPSPSNPGPQQLTSAERSALATYNSKLRARIDSAWNKPEGLAGLQIAVTVLFEVSASGRLSNVRLEGRSASPNFDQSVLAAFQRVRSAGPTPTGQSHVFTMTFRLAE
jgi:TonB family protein